MTTPNAVLTDPENQGIEIKQTRLVIFDISKSQEYIFVL